MAGPPDPEVPIEIMIFNIIYYMGRRGRENLRKMKLGTFEIAQDHDGKRYIYQVRKEHDKNHRENDMKPNNTAQIYEIEGDCCLLSQNWNKVKFSKHNIISE